jgi:hypothetical protein
LKENGATIATYQYDGAGKLTSKAIGSINHLPILNRELLIPLPRQPVRKVQFIRKHFREIWTAISAAFRKQNPDAPKALPMISWDVS